MKIFVVIAMSFLLLTGCATVQTSQTAETVERVARDSGPLIVEMVTTAASYEYGKRQSIEDIMVLKGIVDKLSGGYKTLATSDLGFGRKLIVEKVPPHMIGPVLALWTLVENTIIFEYELAMEEEKINPNAELYIKHALAGIKTGLDSSIQAKGKPV